MGILLIAMVLLAYAAVMLVLFVGLGVKIGGDQGGMVGYLLYILVAGYGGGYIAIVTGFKDWLFGFAG